MAYYRNGIDSIVEYKLALDDIVIHDFALVWDINKTTQYWIKKIHGENADILEANICGSHPDYIGAFFTVIKQIDLEFALNRLPNDINSLDAFSAHANISDYAKKSHSCPVQDSESWYRFTGLVDLWLKQREEYGI
jgi:hypothetical protein